MALGGPDHALDILAAAMPGEALRFDGAGLCQLTVQDAFVLNLQRLDDRRIRAVSYLDGILHAMTARFLLNGMTENHRGGAGRHARFGLHETAGILSIEELIEVAGMEAATFEARILSFIKSVAYWVANADNLFEDPNALEPQVHRTGSGMDDAEFRAFAAFGDDPALLVKV